MAGNPFTRELPRWVGFLVVGVVVGGLLSLVLVTRAMSNLYGTPGPSSRVTVESHCWTDPVGGGIYCSAHN